MECGFLYEILLNSKAFQILYDKVIADVVAQENTNKLKKNGTLYLLKF